MLNLARTGPQGPVSFWAGFILRHYARQRCAGIQRRGVQFANYHMAPIALFLQSSYSGLTRVPMRYCCASGRRGVALSGPLPVWMVGHGPSGQARGRRWGRGGDVASPRAWACPHPHPEPVEGWAARSEMKPLWFDRLTMRVWDRPLRPVHSPSCPDLIRVSYGPSGQTRGRRWGMVAVACCDSCPKGRS